jgi:hypothetical protein
MKNLRILAALAALVFAMSLGLQAQPVDCWDVEEYDCSNWQDAQPVTYEDPEYPGCPITLYFEYQECHINYNTVVSYNFRLKAISFPSSNECNGLLAALQITPPNIIANQVKLFQIWKKGLEKVADDWFSWQDPMDFRCGIRSLTFRTVVPGGCASWAWAFKYNPIAGQTEFRFIPVPCSEDGCCIIDRTLCWNVAEQKVDEETNITIMGGENCGSMSPLYDPFQNYSQEWIRGTPTPCVQMCFIWSVE